MEADQSVVAKAPTESEQPSTDPESVLGSEDHVPSTSPVDSTPVSESKPEEMTSSLIVHSIVADPLSFDSVHMNGAAVVIPSYQPTSVVQNGSLPKEADGIAVGEQLEDVYPLEEERLWNLVRANCLDFNALTALIEET